MTDEARSNQSDYELVNSISVAAFDVDARIFRTLWHSLIRAPGVTLAAIRGDYTRYISPVRVLIALFGIQFGLAAIFGSPMTPTVETLAPQVTPERFAAWLNGHDPAAIDRALETGVSLMIWPMTILSSLPFLILLKLYRPSLKFWTHLCVFLVPTNASTIVFILLLPTLTLWDGAIFIAMSAMLAVYFGLTGWLLARFYSRSAFGTAMRITGLVLMLPVTFLISAACQILAVSWILDSQFGLSLLGLFES
ncbi:hypothetical protein [Maricaulis sp.]|uniref:hypothetical protein n=1 Tax=Maricaulis sp. TaxID=1486257 RepID=UPI003A904684